MKHFELTDDKIQVYGRTLSRIRALRDIPCQNVKKGDLGGYIETLENLADEAWVSGEARVFGKAWVSGDIKLERGYWGGKGIEVTGIEGLERI